MTIERLNALHDSAHAEGWPMLGHVNANLAAGFARAVREAGIGWNVVPARPKRTILDWYLPVRAGVDGMTDPFFLETLVAGNILPFERPFVVAHEWSHLAGIADEGEANYTAWRSCVPRSAADAYSGWLFLYGELSRAVGRAGTRARCRPRLAPAARRSARDSRSLRARRQSARVRRGVARLRLVPESQPRRGRDGELRRGRAARARAARERTSGAGSPFSR